MKTLVLDFLRRWGWMLALLLLLTAFISATGQPFVLAPSALICLIFDAQRGVFRVVRPLPVPRFRQACAWWLIGVPLVPLLSLGALAIGVVIFQATHPLVALPAPPMLVEVGAQAVQIFAPPMSAVSPWFGVGVQTWVAFGYAGLCFRLAMGLPTRPAVGALEATVQGVFGGLWGLSMMGLVFILPNLPKTPAAVAPWHLAVFAAVPVCVVLSFLAAPGLMQRRMFVVAAKARPRAASESVAPDTGLTGATLFVANFVVRFVMVMAAIAIGHVIVLRLIIGRANSPVDHIMAIQIVSIAIAFSIFAGEAVGMRVLRALPLSTVRLALLLSLLPWAAGAIGGVVTALWNGLGDPALPPLLNFVGQAVAFGGLGALAQTITLHITTAARLLVILFFAAVPAAVFTMLPTHTAIFALVGVTTGTLAFALLVRGLRKSNSFYQQRRIFGMAVGQWVAVR